MGAQCATDRIPSSQETSPGVVEVELGHIHDALPEIAAKDGRRILMKAVSRTESHALAVGCEMPQSPATPDRLKLPQAGPQSSVNRSRVMRSATSRTIRTSR